MEPGAAAAARPHPGRRWPAALVLRRGGRGAAARADELRRLHRRRGTRRPVRGHQAEAGERRGLRRERSVCRATLGWPPAGPRPGRRSRAVAACQRAASASSAAPARTRESRWPALATRRRQHLQSPQRTACRPRAPPAPAPPPRRPACAPRWRPRPAPHPRPPACLRRPQLAQEKGGEVSVCVIEKGSEVGAHILSGNVLEPRALDELLPGWKEMEGLPLVGGPAGACCWIWIGAGAAGGCNGPGTLQGWRFRHAWHPATQPPEPPSLAGRGSCCTWRAASPGAVAGAPAGRTQAAAPHTATSRRPLAGRR
jgi:hypothetical protein